MAEKLYLIRVNLESFLGPMTLQELRRAYKRMEFQLQDEVAGSNKEWVAFDDLHRIRKVYPELLDLVKKDMLSGWGKTEHHVSLKGERESTKIVKRRSRRSPWRGMMVAVMMLGVSVGSYFLVRHYDEFAGRILASTDPLLAKAQESFEDADTQKFDVFMDKSLSEVLSNIKQRKSNLDDWLPYLRAYAFRRNGKIDGIDLRHIRGGGRVFAPRDCTLDAWKARWRASAAEWGRMLEGKDLPVKDWSKILVWDPYWVKSRSPQKGWLEPTSIYEGCTRIALKALQETDVERSQQESKAVILSRLEWLLRHMSEEPRGTEFSMAGGLWALSCLESTERPDDVSACQSGVSLDREWGKLVGQRAVLTKIRLLLQSKVVKATQMELFRALVEEVKSVDSITGFEYLPEQRYYQQVLTNGGKVTQAKNSLRYKFPDFYFD